MQKLLPSIQKIRKLVTRTNKNHDIFVDTLIKKRFISKLNQRISGEYKIMITTKTTFWTSKSIDLNHKSLKRVYNVSGTMIEFF